MQHAKNPVTGLPQTSSSSMKAERRRQPFHGKRTSLMTRVRGIDCMLADIEAEIQRLRHERIYLRLVRGGMTETLSGGFLQKLVS